MATVTQSPVKAIVRPFPRSERRLQKKLRSTGQEYVSRTGKIVPAKKFPADVLCSCPQRCDERVPKEARERLFTYFYALADFEKQNAFLREHLEVRSRPPDDDPNRSQRRITCKYLVPILPTDISTYQPINSECYADNNNVGLSQHLLNNGTSITTIESGENNGNACTVNGHVPNSKPTGRSAQNGDTKIDVCQKAFVSAFVITEKRARRVREKMFSRLGLTVYQHMSAQDKAAAQQALQQQNSKISLIQLPLNRPPSAADDSNNSEDVPAPWDNPLVPPGIRVPEGVTIAPVTQCEDHDRDVAIVNNFFSNQLWKLEYITS